HLRLVVPALAADHGELARGRGEFAGRLDAAAGEEAGVVEFALDVAAGVEAAALVHDEDGDAGPGEYGAHLGGVEGRALVVQHAVAGLEAVALAGRGGHVLDAVIEGEDVLPLDASVGGRVGAEAAEDAGDLAGLEGVAELEEAHPLAHL